MFPKIWVFTPKIIHFDRVFHYKPSILGKPPMFGNTHKCCYWGSEIDLEIPFARRSYWTSCPSCAGTNQTQESWIERLISVLSRYTNSTDICWVEFHDISSLRHFCMAFKWCPLEKKTKKTASLWAGIESFDFPRYRQLWQTHSASALEVLSLETFTWWEMRAMVSHETEALRPQMLAFVQLHNHLHMNLEVQPWVFRFAQMSA